MYRVTVDINVGMANETTKKSERRAQRKADREKGIYVRKESGEVVEWTHRAAVQHRKKDELGTF
jgi:hypothetical protein